MTKRITFLTVMAVAASFLVGCATPPKPIPFAYYQQHRPMTVKVVSCPPQAQMMDSGQGGLIGAMFTAAVRGSSMRKQLQGIKGDAVSELVRQKITDKLECCFDITEQSNDLATEINIMQYGWFVPTTALGIKTGSYQFRMSGLVNVFDLAQKRKQIGYVVGASEQPLGNDPTAEATQEALLKAVDDFTNKAMVVILAQKPPEK